MASLLCFQSTSRALLQLSPSLRVASVSSPTPTRHRLAAGTYRHLTTPARRLGFLLDIDGVLMGGSVGDRGKRAISWLQRNRVPFVLMTNGGGASTVDRARSLSDQLDAEPALTEGNVVQAHTPMLEALKHLREKRVYIVGAKEGAWQRIAEELQLQKADNVDSVLAAYPDIWPFRDPPSPRDPPPWSKEPFAGVIVVHDSRDYGADAQIMIDILASKDGTPGNPKDSRDSWAEKDQIPLYFSNGDLLWKAAFPVSRLGQGSFRVAFEALFMAVCKRPVYSQTFGKPTLPAYERAKDMLEEQNANLGHAPLERIIMVGDNPQSDIAGANNAGIESILVKTGVFEDGEPSHRPTIIQEDVLAGIEWAVKRH